MSDIRIKYHNECIDMILYVPPPPRPKSPLPISDRVKQLRCQKRDHCVPQTRKTMGEAETTLKLPCQYLRKGEGIKKTIPKKDKCCVDVLYDKLKKVEIDEEKGEKKIKNKEKQHHVVCNKEKEYFFVDTVKGHRSKIIRNKYIFEEGYGTVPEYVITRNQDRIRDEKEYREVLENQEPLCKLVSAEERQQLLDGLIQNKNKLNREYLLLPMMIDSIPKLMRKTQLEIDLRTIDDDVKLVEEHPYIYIYE